MEQTSNNRFALLEDETRPPSPINHAPPPGMFTTAADVAAMEAVATELYLPTPTPAEPPLPTTALESLNNPTLIPSQTPEGMVAINVDSSPPEGALVAPPLHSPTPQLFTDGAAAIVALESADHAQSATHGIEVTTYIVDPLAAAVPNPDPTFEATPSPDTIFDRQAEALYNAWMALLDKMNPRTMAKLQTEYSTNTVGNLHIWMLACWLHRAPAPRVLAFLRTHSPSTTMIEAIQHAFATRLTRLRGQLADHGKHTEAVRMAIMEWNSGCHHAPTPDMLPSPGPDTLEAMRQAVPSPIVTQSPGAADAPISISSDSSVELVLPRDLTAFERAKRRASRSQSISRPPSRRPSISLQDMVDRAFSPDRDEAMGGSDSSTTPTAPTSSSPWTHQIPKADWPSEWGSHTPSEHSSVDRLTGDHPRHPILVDTPSDPTHTSVSTRSPPADMGRPDPKGRMTATGLIPRPLSPMEVLWGPSTQTQAARTVLEELRGLSRAALPLPAEISETDAASIDEAVDWATIWADTIAPLREGYARYMLREPLPLIKGGNRIEPPHALDTAFKVVVAALGVGFDKPGCPQDRTLASNHWFRGASAILSATIRGMLVSQAFFDQGSWPVEPCMDDFKLESDLETPGSQLELLRSMAEQLLSELTVQGEDRLNREDLWNSIKEQEIGMLRDSLRRQAEREAEVWEHELLASLKGKALDRALTGLIEDLEAEGSMHESGIKLAKQTLDRVTAQTGRPGIVLVPAAQIAKWQNQYVIEAREELKAAAVAQAEREWQSWRENQFAKASGEAMRRLSIDYIIDKCGPDAQAIIAEKQNFAKEYAHCNYQNWLDQVLTERWPSVEADAQAFSREDYFNRELAAIYPEVHQEAHDAARKEALQAAALFQERLTNQKCSATQSDHDATLYRASIKATTSKKVRDSQKGTGKAARAIKVDARRTDIAQVLDALDYDSDPPAEPITHGQLVALVEEDSNMGTDKPPNAAYKLGAAMGLVEPIEGIAPQVRPHLGFAPSPETIGEPTLSPHLAVMTSLPTVNEEVAATCTIHSSVYAEEAEPSPPPPAAGDHALFAMLQQLLAPLQESVDALRLRVEVIDDWTLPKPQTHSAHSATPLLPPSEVTEGTPPALAPPPPPPVGTAGPSKGSSSNSSKPKGPAGRPTPKAPIAQNPTPSPPGPPSQEATTGARTAEVSPSPPSAGARTDPATTTPSLPDAPSPPAKPTPKGKGKATGASTASVAPSPPSKGARTVPDNDGRSNNSRPPSNRLPPRRLHNNAPLLDASSQEPPPPPAPRNTTRVVVARHGGFPDAAREAALRGDLPERIAASVRSAIERSTSNPIKILSGRWAKGVEKTGNYVYKLTGKIPMERILQFSKFLLQPFPGGTLIPAEGWCWAQLREVLVHDDDNTVHSEETLFEEITRNPVFDGIPFVQRPHWERNIISIDTATATVVFAYIDPAGKVAKEAKNTGIFMFNYGTKFVFAGDSPRPKQCGRCFLIGHITNAPECRWNGKNRCVRCGLDHHHDDHNTSCTATTHKSADRCDCVFKCLLCGKTGHNARNRKCPARGDFPPPRAAPRLSDENGDEPAPSHLSHFTDAVPTHPKSILKRPTEIPSSPLARVDDDDEPGLFDPSALAMEGVEPDEPAPPAPKPVKPKACIVLPSTDTAKPHETSTERAATRLNEAKAPPAPKPIAAAGPGPVEDFPALPAAIPNTTYDHNTHVHIEDRAHQLLSEAVQNVAIVQVGDFFYRCPLNEMNIPFRRLRDREMLILNKMRYGDTLGPEDKFNFTAKYEREARKSRAFGNFDLHGNPTTEDLFPSAILTPTKPVLPL
ncbi:hypothetical protein EDB84DRAFT_1559176 [Lactarius hengduanensis]|nr:hypothetical protein EDB84DRAFT_1559176 [Lactarius hengduanensis]